MHPKLRDFFDLRVEQVLADLPERIHVLFDESPLHVEDHPPREILEQFGLKHREALCGLHTGVPLTEKRSLWAPAGIVDPNAITIYREGILCMAGDAAGNLREDELLRQIKITILHELGHYHGLDEEDLAELGYA